MRFIFSIPVILLLFFGSSVLQKQGEIFPGRTKTVGVYDQDSVLQRMPEYRMVMDSTKAYQKAQDGQLFRMKASLEEKQATLKKDSAQWSPVERELRKKEIRDLQENIEKFQAESKVDVEAYQQKQLQPLLDKMKLQAKLIAKDHPFDDVLDKDELDLLYPDHKGIKVVNVTRLMMRELSVKK